MVAAAVGMAAGVGLVLARRDGVGGGGCGRGSVAGCGCGGVFYVVCAGIGGCCSVVLSGTCCHICIGAVFCPACAAVRGAGLCLLLGGCLSLRGFRYGRHGHRSADHGRARDRAEQVVKGSFHSGASR